MKRYGNLTTKLLSDENILTAIHDVNKTHRRGRHHKPNGCVLWVERTLPERVEELRGILVNGFTPSPARRRTIYDVSSRKYRDIYEPKLWPDQYVHHALIQVIQPAIMRGMDYWNCGSIPGRGPKRGIHGIQKWMREDPKGTRYCAELDIKSFYGSLQPYIVLQQLRHIIKDERVLALCREVMADGVPIGCYCSQWFANAVLQPMDEMIRQSGNADHYVRYMDNLTLFASSKRKLKRAIHDIRIWLAHHEMRLHPSWQIFPTKDRMPDAMGYRYGRGYTLPRKRTLLRFKRACGRVIKRGKATLRQARSILSRVGGLKKCGMKNIRTRWVDPIGERKLKQVVRTADREKHQNRSKTICPAAA